MTNSKHQKTEKKRGQRKNDYRFRKEREREKERKKKKERERED